MKYSCCKTCLEKPSTNDENQLLKIHDTKRIKMSQSYVGWKRYNVLGSHRQERVMHKVTTRCESEHNSELTGVCLRFF